MLEARKAKADSAAMARVGQTVDSTLEKTGRGVSTVVSKAAGVAETVVARTEQGVIDAASRLRNGDGPAVARSSGASFSCAVWSPRAAACIARTEKRAPPDTVASKRVSNGSSSACRRSRAATCARWRRRA